MRALIACEESQRVCTAFRKRGWQAFSCDVQECSGGHPEWHIKGDVTPIIKGVDRQKERSKTFQGIADAMAEQWGRYLEELYV